jgi:acetyltransferase EpsM
MQIVVIGARVDGGVRGVVEIARLAGHEIVGFVDDREQTAAEIFGAPFLGDRQVLPKLRAKGFTVVIGENRARRVLFEAAAAAGLKPVSLVHPTAWLSETASVEPGAILFPGAVIMAGTRAGRGLIVNTNASVDHDNVIGDFVNVSPGAHTGGRVRLGDGVLVGIGASILPDVRIGPGSVVGAGAVVVKNVPGHWVCVGVPARKLRSVKEKKHGKDHA